MQIAVLGNPCGWYCRDLRRAAESRGHGFVAVDFASFVGRVGSPHGLVSANGFDLSSSDAVIVRTMPPGSLEQVVFRMDALAGLEATGVCVVNSPKAIECAVDKYLATSKLAAAGLSVPETIVCENADAALEAFTRLEGDVVVKPIFGGEGRGIMRVSDPDLAFRAFRTLERIDSVMYVQKYIQHPGFDIRVMVLGRRVLGAIKRRSQTDFRTNVSRDAQSESHQMTAEEEEWALRASLAVGTRIAGVDLLYDENGTRYVLEVNGVPGWRAFGRSTGCDVAELLIEDLEQLTKNRDSL